MDLGFRRAGHTIVWANDIDKDAVQTYRLNLGEHVRLGDICKIRLTDLPDADIVIGGFPCQGFSRANMLRSVCDERNALYRQFLRVIRGKKPRYFVAENVSGILSLGGGAIVQRIANDFKAAGFNIEYRLFNVADFGVPQQRRRVIFLGWRKDLSEAERPHFPPPSHSATRVNDLKLKPWVSIAEALNGVPEPNEPHRLKNHVCSKYKVTNRDFTGHRPTNPDKPSPTILARGNGKGGVCAIHHPNNHRRLSVRESAIVQTFPRHFEFVGALNSMYRQVGNAVPVLFAEKLARAFTVLEEKSKASLR